MGLRPVVAGLRQLQENAIEVGAAIRAVPYKFPAESATDGALGFQAGLSKTGMKDLVPGSQRAAHQNKDNRDRSKGPFKGWHVCRMQPRLSAMHPNFFADKANPKC